MCTACTAVLLCCIVSWVWYMRIHNISSNWWDTQSVTHWSHSCTVLYSTVLYCVSVLCVLHCTAVLLCCIVSWVWYTRIHSRNSSLWDTVSLLIELPTQHQAWIKTLSCRLETNSITALSRQVLYSCFSLSCCPLASGLPQPWVNTWVTCASLFNVW